MRQSRGEMRSARAKLPACLRKNEHQEQSDLFYLAALHTKRFPVLKLLYAIPNGGTRPWKTNDKGQRYSPVAMRLKAEGVKPGVPDVFFPVPRGRYHGLYIEMKVKPNTVSDDQKDWLKDLEEQGYCTAVCWTGQEAWELVQAYLSGKPLYFTGALTFVPPGKKREASGIVPRKA